MALERKDKLLSPPLEFKLIKKFSEAHLSFTPDLNVPLRDICVCEDVIEGCVLWVTMSGLRRPVLFLFMPLALLVLQSRSFELQDTIHALIEENIHLHDQLENLTQALRELKRMLWHHSNGT